MIKVIGHLAPDTDSTCAPIVYTWYLSEKKDMEARPFVTGEFNREAKYVLERFGFHTPELLTKLTKEDEFVVVDTNNPDELVEGHADAKLLEIIDHHKLVGGLSTPDPISITIRPWACTMTVMWDIMKQDGVAELPSEIAGIMLAAILSDTLKFTSPTTTEMDTLAAEELAEMAGVEIDELAEEMFAAKSDLTGMSAKDLLLVDSKVFELGDKKVRIAVLETTKPENSLDMKAELMSAIEELRAEQELDGVFFFAVDILNTKSHLVVNGDFEKEIAEKAFESEFVDDVMELDGVVSRKKQIVPNIEKAIG